jgi:prepilin-type N-terminal cleavage/methylation domain-containing protein
MKLTNSTTEWRRRGRAASGFNLIEVMVSVWVIGLMIVSLYGGFSYAFSEIRLARENLRAAQILAERMEVVRLLNWDQVANLPNYIPTTFAVPFNPTGNASPGTDGGVVYSGTVSVGNSAITENYSNDLRMIRIQVTWTSGNMVRWRQMTTFVSQYGLQRYVY